MGEFNVDKWVVSNILKALHLSEDAVLVYSLLSKLNARDIEPNASQLARVFEEEYVKKLGYATNADVVRMVQRLTINPGLRWLSVLSKRRLRKLMNGEEVKPIDQRRRRYDIIYPECWFEKPLELDDYLRKPHLRINGKVWRFTHRHLEAVVYFDNGDLVIKLRPNMKSFLPDEEKLNEEKPKNQTNK